ncbi:hypothetical protein V6N11_065474 [Hibiscus sabdariffa]|uniref:Uncharacterized protein n=1 Tax=Hibiscus sabdariffa TaxID=183260 RepID=A0ABR2PHE5_9ROSI
MAKGSHSIRKEREQGIEEAQQQLKIMEDELKGKQIFAGRRIGDDLRKVLVAWRLAWLKRGSRKRMGSK